MQRMFVSNPASDMTVMGHPGSADGLGQADPN